MKILYVPASTNHRVYESASAQRIGGLVAGGGVTWAATCDRDSRDEMLTVASKLLCCASGERGENDYSGFRRGYDDRPIERDENGNVIENGPATDEQSKAAPPASYDSSDAVGKLTSFFGAVAAKPIEAVGMKPFWRRGFVELDDGDDLEENRPRCCGLAYPRNRDECKNVAWQLFAFLLVIWNLYIIFSVMEYTWFPHD